MSKKLPLFLILASVLTLFLFFFFPRPLADFLPSSDSLAEITLLQLDANGESEKKEVSLSGEELDDFLKKAKNIRLFRRPFRKEYANNGPDYIGCFLIPRSIGDAISRKTLFLFTRDILNIDGKQYGLYGNGLAEAVLASLSE